MEIGTLMHEAMDAMITEFSRPAARLRRAVVAGASPPAARPRGGPGPGVEERGLTGHPRLWQAERARILRDLDRMLRDDDRGGPSSTPRCWPASSRSVSVSSEPVRLELGDGRGTVLLKGKADKVDVTRDGVLLVTDIKTGSSTSYKKIKKDPVVDGTKLQLPAYAYAARNAFGDNEPSAQYWFVRKDTSGSRSALDETTEERYRDAVAILVTAISAGQFPANRRRPTTATAAPTAARTGSVLMIFVGAGIASGTTRARDPGGADRPVRSHRRHPMTASADTEILSDQAARDRIRDATDRTLFVDAGAGSGKTKALVDRVLTLVLRDGVPIEQIAAVTFTEKAAAELTDRLRARFEKAAHDPTIDDQDRQRAAQALDELDFAAIGTLHSFAQRILTLHPIEARIPPYLQVLDEVGSTAASEERWAVIQRRLLDDDGIGDILVPALAMGVTLKDLHSLAERSTTTGTSPRTGSPTRCRRRCVPDATSFFVRAAEVARTAAGLPEAGAGQAVRRTAAAGRDRRRSYRPHLDAEEQHLLLQRIADAQPGKPAAASNWPQGKTIRWMT